MTESIHPEVEAFEFDEGELAERPRAIIALVDGPNWHVLNEHDDVVGLLESYREADVLVEFEATQDEPGLGPAPVWIRPSQVSCVLGVSEQRWKVDRFKRHLQEQQMRRAQAGGALATPGGPIG